MKVLAIVLVICLASYVNSDGPRKSGKSGKSGNSRNSGNSGRSGNSGNSGRSGNSGNSGRSGNSGNSDNSGDSGKSDGENLTNNDPWHVSVWVEGRGGSDHKCSGVLVGERTVLTAANCTHGLKTRDVFVKYGGRNYNELANEVDVANIRELDMLGEGWGIAVLTLKRDIQTSKGYIEVIPLTDEIPSEGKNGYLTGWVPDTDPKFVLKHNRATIMPRSRCRTIIEPNMLCTNRTYGVHCVDEAGGPLVMDGKLVGIVTPAPGNCIYDRMEAHIEITYYRDYLKYLGI